MKYMPILQEYVGTDIPMSWMDVVTFANSDDLPPLGLSGYENSRFAKIVVVRIGQVSCLIIPPFH